MRVITRARDWSVRPLRTHILGPNCPGSEVSGYRYTENENCRVWGLLTLWWRTAISWTTYGSVQANNDIRRIHSRSGDSRLRASDVFTESTSRISSMSTYSRSATEIANEHEIIQSTLLLVSTKHLFVHHRVVQKVSHQIFFVTTTWYRLIFKISLLAYSAGNVQQIGHR